MIMIWNQRQVFTCRSLDKLFKARQVLAENNIEYTYKATHHDIQNLFTSEKGKISIFDEKIEFCFTYCVYVRDRDYELACSLLKTI